MSEALPDGWSKMTFGDILSHRKMPGQPGDDLLSVTAKKGVIRQSESGRRDISSGDKGSYNRVLPGDVVYNTMRMWQGVSGVSGFPGIVSPAYTVCVPNGLVDADFLSYLLKHPSYVNKFRRMSQGLVSDTWNLKFSQFSKLNLIIPSFAEQRRVAEILNAVDEANSSSAGCVEKLFLARTGLISSALSGTAVLAGDRASLGSRLLGMQAGYSPNVPSRPAGGDQWGVLKVSSVQSSGFFEDENKVIENPGDVIPELEVHHGDLLMTRANTSNLVGLSCLVDSPRPRLILSDKILRLNVREDLADKGYVDLLIKSSSGRRQIEALGTGSSAGMKNVSRGEVRSLMFPWPELKEQQRVVSIVQAHDERIAVEKARLEKLRKLKAGLMDDLLTGRVRVNQLDELPV